MERWTNGWMMDKWMVGEWWVSRWEWEVLEKIKLGPNSLFCCTIFFENQETFFSLGHCWTSKGFKR